MNLKDFITRLKAIIDLDGEFKTAISDKELLKTVKDSGWDDGFYMANNEDGAYFIVVKKI